MNKQCFKIFIIHSSYLKIKNNKNNNLNKTIFNLFLFIYYILGILLYFLSLKRIYGLEMKCFSKSGIFCFYIIAKIILISSILTSSSLYLIIFHNYFKFHIIIIILIYSALFYYDHDNGIEKHGLYNIIIFILSTSLLFILLSYCHYLYSLYKKRNYNLFFISIIPFLCFYFIFRIYKYKGLSCTNWEKGFNNSFIDNYSKDYPCLISIPKPHSCFLPGIGPFIDFSKRIRPTCQEVNLLKSERKNLLNDLKKIKYFDESKNNLFGYPITNNDNKNPDDFGTICMSLKENFFDYINNNVILIDLSNEKKLKEKYYNNKAKPEILIKLNNDSGKIIIKINKNETLKVWDLINIIN